MTATKIGISPADLRLKIIRPTLFALSLKPSVAVENLILGTAAQESLMGHYLHQRGGRALGIYQMEEATHDDIWTNYLEHKRGLRGAVLNLYKKEKIFRAHKMIYDLRYATIMTRIHYYRVPQPLPEADDILGMAKYWKVYYNTSQGKGTTEDFIKNFNYFDIL